MIKAFFRDNKIHKSIVKNFDSFFLLRPTLFFGVWVMVVLGMATAKMSMIKFPIWIVGFDYSTFCLFSGLSLVCSSTFIVNQIVDANSDQKNKKLFLIGREVEAEYAKKLGIVLNIFGFLFFSIGNIFLTPLLALIYFFWGVLYNNYPYEWKKRPFLGVISNAIVGILLFLIGWIHISGIFNIQYKILFLSIIPYIFSFTAVSLMTNIPDIDGDLHENYNTFSVRFGPRVTSLLATILVIVSFFWGYYNSDPIISTASLCSVPFFLFALIRNLDKDILRSIRYPIFLLNFFVFAIYPLLFIFVFMVYYLSKYYYWHRFDIHYPTFLVEDD